MKPACVAVLASGEGTTTEAFVREAAKYPDGPQIVLVISNKSKAGIFARIEKLNKELGLNIKTKLIGRKTHPPGDDEHVGPGDQSVDEEQAIIDELKKAQVDIVVLMGYMRKVGAKLVDEFGWRKSYASPYQARMLNTHAGLLPDTKGYYGRHKEEHVIAEGYSESGVTLHLVAQDYDEGPIIAEHRIGVAKDETVDSLLARDQALEKQYIYKDVAEFITKRRKFLEGK